MISKYLLWTSVLTVNIMLLSSCLGSSGSDYEYPVDPQIYAISMASTTDSTSQLKGLSFTIDQINNKIYNKEPLPYLFHVDSVMLTITGSSNYYSFTGIYLSFEQPDSTFSYYWNMSDSISFVGLKSIKTTAPDGVTTKDYTFQLNIYQEDPDSIVWERMVTNHPAPLVAEQKTVVLGNKFFTYYQTSSSGNIHAVSASIAATPEWEKDTTLLEFPNTVRLSSIITVGGNLYALDETNGKVYQTTDGFQWNALSFGYKVKALYGKVPFSTSENVLMAVDDAGTLKFRQANSDFTSSSLMNDVPVDIPVTGFCSLNISSSDSYATQFIILSGGTTAGNDDNKDIWLMQANGNGAIQLIAANRPEEGNLKGSSLFYYEKKPYLVTTTTDGKNQLYYSDDNGLRWTLPGGNKAFPSEPIAFTGRTHASVVTDSDNYIWIFGGISSTNPNTRLTDIWRGRLNKFGL